MATEMSDLGQYETDNVLGGSDNTFGVEIECEGRSTDFGNRVASRLHEEGLCDTRYQTSYHSHRTPGMFAVETDGSLSSSGAEIVSPVLRDTPEDWDKLWRVCEIIQEEGGRATRRCGGHVHIGSSPLDSEGDLYSKLVRVYGAFQDVLYRIGAAGERHRGAGRRYTYSSPLDRSRLVPRFGNVNEVRRHQGRYGGLNLTGAGGTDHSTVEFRLFDGTVDAHKIQMNVKLASAMVDLARLDPPDEVIPEPQEVGHHESNPDERHTRVRQFCDMLFHRARDQLKVLQLYTHGAWQPAH
jgi:hypothetical protein